MDLSVVSHPKIAEKSSGGTGIVLNVRDINLDRCAASLYFRPDPARKLKVTHLVHPRDTRRNNPHLTNAYSVLNIDDMPGGKLFFVMEYGRGAVRRSIVPNIAQSSDKP